MKSDKWKQRITIYSFFICLVGLTAAFVILPKQSVSKAERRRLAAKPVLTFEKIIKEDFMDDLETYLLDHFPFRDGLRKIKAYFAYDVLQQKENNDIYVTEGHAAKLEYPLNESETMRAAEKMKSVKAKYFPQAQVYYAVIPDKNFFLAQKNNFPSLDYAKMLEILHKNLAADSFVYIDIMEGLTIEDYYKTDTHWRQERILETAKRLVDGLGVSDAVAFDLAAYQIQEIPDFYGVYYGQSALPMVADTICYLTNEVIDSAQVWNMETGKTNPVYELDKLESEKSMDKYDIFLGGAVPLQIIDSPKAKTDKRLIIFRDSYTSSLAPLLLETYKEITLVDLRYISSELIGEYVDFESADILFLYNTVVLNHSSMLK